MGLLVGIMTGAGIPIYAKAPVLNPDSYSSQFLEARTIHYIPSLNLEMTDYDPCSCISFVKSVLNFKGVFGNAEDLIPNTDIAVGVVILFKDHAGIVTDLNSKTVSFEEANYLKCKRSSRTLPRNDPKIKGYYKVIH